MGDLSLPVAQNLAASLCTIGHPFSQPVINATAMDLIKWCHGARIDTRTWTPEQQAEDLVEEARMTWTEGWQAKGGTAGLHSLFVEKFKSSSQQLEQKSLSPEDAIRRGLIAPICEVCDGSLYVGNPPDRQYCTACPAGRRHAKWEGEAALDRINHPPAARTLRLVLAEPLTYEKMQAAIEDEKRRKQEQLEKLKLADKSEAS